MTDDDQFLADLHAIADRARASELEGSAAPNSWQHVLATVNATTETTTERRLSMHTNIAQPMSPVWKQPISHSEQSRSFGGSIRRFTNHAATIALVLAVAVGGWLAMSQMPSGDSDPRFAVLGTPAVADASCDVEPMTVDEVLEIVENPYKYAEPSAYGPRNSSPAPWYDDFAEVQPMVSESVSAVLGQEPTDNAMQEALAILDQYQACMETGTMAHVLRFVDPFSIQGRVTQEFPFYRDEEQVREFVTNWIEETPAPLEWKNDETGVVLTFSPNRNTEEAKTQFLWLGLGFNQLLFIGSNVMDEHGNFLARHDATFEIVEGEQQERFTRYTLVYSMYTETWYVVPGDWPMAPRI